MLSLKFPRHFPIHFRIKKYGILWRRIGYCCGLDHYKPQCTLLIHFAFKDTYSWRCPQCGKIHGTRLSWHTTEFFDKEMREQNKLLEEK